MDFHSCSTQRDKNASANNYDTHRRVAIEGERPEGAVDEEKANLFFISLFSLAPVDDDTERRASRADAQ